jgi:hypothetical protein
VRRHLTALAVVGVAAVTLFVGRAGAAAISGCTIAGSLPAADDVSAGPIALPFMLKFFGDTPYDALFVNNNGNVTFNDSLDSFTPDPIGSGNTGPIIAPYWADVDTTGSGSPPVSYGTTTFGGRTAFCATWNGVGYYSQPNTKRNKFQVLLVDRSDVNPGDFDIVFNYDQVQWETGDASGGTNGLGGFSARAGYSNGAPSNPTSFELPGSGTPGSFLDGNLSSGLTHTDQNSSTLGRYVFPVRNGAPPAGGSIWGKIYHDSAGAGNEFGGASVQVCNGTNCRTTTASGGGTYVVYGLADGTYTAKAFAPRGYAYSPGAYPGTVNIAGGAAVTGRNIVLTAPAPPLAGYGIAPSGDGLGGVPTIFSSDSTTLTATGCSGTASYTITAPDGSTRNGVMTESPFGSGNYTAPLDPFTATYGTAHAVISFSCQGPVSFDFYVNPSGKVKDPQGNPIAGATVTLLDANRVPIPDGSGIMSPSNQYNPDLTDSGGHYGWDVLAGSYIVRAENQGCVDPNNPSKTYVESAVFSVPPAVTNVDLVLRCAPTAVQIRSFSARRQAGGSTLVTWRTGSETGVLGFDVYGERAGHRARLNSRLIVARGGVAGSRYTWLDRHAAASARYWLQIVRAGGARVWRGPVRATRS